LVDAARGSRQLKGKAGGAKKNPWTPIDPERGGWTLSAGLIPAAGNGERVTIVSRIEAQDAVAVDAVQGFREACHDMRQPVACILALASAALAEPGLPRAVPARLKEIVQQAEWLAEMIQDGLRAAESGSPGTALSEPVARADLARILSEVVAAECITSPVKVSVVWPAEPLHASVHPVVLRRIMANVLSNAARAAGSSGSVTIEIQSQDGRALVVVDDSGPGFGGIQEDLGLGLREVARNVAKYGGWLECGCSPLGGARVSLSLPLPASLPRLAST
jgi:signal transduction histidine kinase